VNETPPVDLTALRKLDAIHVDHTNQGDSFLRVRDDINDIANAAADEIERLRGVMQSIIDDADMAYYERRQGDWFLLRLKHALNDSEATP
jgi:hypothetical protein